eukprot:6377427-Alexandrium_andersonii.AAC.1
MRRPKTGANEDEDLPEQPLNKFAEDAAARMDAEDPNAAVCEKKTAEPKKAPALTYAKAAELA